MEIVLMGITLTLLIKTSKKNPELKNWVKSFTFRYVGIICELIYREIEARNIPGFMWVYVCFITLSVVAVLILFFDMKSQKKKIQTNAISPAWMILGHTPPFLFIIGYTQLEFREYFIPIMYIMSYLLLLKSTKDNIEIFGTTKQSTNYFLILSQIGLIGVFIGNFFRLCNVEGDFYIIIFSNLIFTISLLVIGLMNRFKETLYKAVSRKDEAEDKLMKLNSELELKVKERTQEIEESRQDLEIFSETVAHDIKAPIRHILGFSNVLLEEVNEKSCADRIDLLNRIKSGAHKIESVINAMLRIQKISKRELDPLNINMKPLINDIWHELGKQFDLDAAEYVIQDGFNKIEGDKYLIEISFTELLSNAIEFTQNKENPKIIIGMDKTENRKTAFYIKDNGIGFDPNYKNKIFQIFRRLDSNEKDEDLSEGIGLTIVKRIVKMHGGKIWAESELGKGATFYFDLGY